MIPLRRFRNKEFAGAQVAVFSISASFFAIFLYTTLYLQQILGLSPIQAGLVYLPASAWSCLLPSLLVGGLGTGLYNPAGAAVALGSAPPEQSGLAAGVNDTFRQAGIAVGVGLFGALLPGAAALGHGSADSFVDGLHTAL